MFMGRNLFNHSRWTRWSPLFLFPLKFIFCLFHHNQNLVSFKACFNLWEQPRYFILIYLEPSCIFLMSGMGQCGFHSRFEPDFISFNVEFTKCIHQYHMGHIQFNVTFSCCSCKNSKQWWPTVYLSPYIGMLLCI